MRHDVGHGFYQQDGSFRRISTASYDPCFIVPMATITRSNNSKFQEGTSDIIKELKTALQNWQRETNTPYDQMPTDIRLRQCDIAHKLHLASLVMRAGGYRRVCQELNLTPMDSHRKDSRRRQLAQLAISLEEVCRNNSLPPPHISFPSLQEIRSADPILANRIAAFPNRAGYTSLAKYVGSYLNSENPLVDTRAPSSRTSMGDPIRPSTWGRWTCFNQLCEELQKFQPHPNVMPPLNSLPTALSSAIQRKGGSALFARRANLADYKIYLHLTRLSTLVHWLAGQVPLQKTVKRSPKQYVRLVQHQSENAPSFPISSAIAMDGMWKEVRRFGGKRFLALRLGYSRADAIRGLFMGPFSVQLAADVLAYSLEKSIPADDGYIAMPTVDVMESDGFQHLAAAVRHFGGEDTVGRRLGLISSTISTQTGDHSTYSETLEL